MKKLVFALTLLAAQGLTLAATSLEEQLAARFEGDRTGACVAAAVIEGSQVQRALFCARAEGKSNLDQAFEIGSVTKTMTAFLVADLIHQGRWSLDDPLAKHLPAGTVLPRQGERQIQLRDVLSHSAGLPALPARLRPANPADPYANLSEADLLASLADMKLGSPIGSQAAYSNFGLMLVSLAVARAYGSDFETALRERLFQPLQMDGAFIATPGPKAAPATGHLPTGALTAAWTIPVNLAGVGMVKATLDDMVRYAQAQLGSDERMRMTQQPLAHGFGMGWALSTVKGHRLMLHEGGTGGFSSLIALDPERQRAVLLLADAALSDLGGLGDIGLALLGVDVPVQGPRRVTVAPAALRQALLGDFDLAGLPLRIFEQGDRLLLQAQGQPAFELRYDSRGDFYLQAFSALLTPITVAGRIDRFAWRQGGGRVEAHRREVPK